jgi:hypothetical protein
MGYKCISKRLLGNDRSQRQQKVPGCPENSICISQLAAFYKGSDEIFL